MLSPNYLDNVANDIVELYEKLNQSVIKDMARRIVNMDMTVSSSTLWQSNVLQQSGYLQSDIFKNIAPIINKSEKEIETLFFAAGEQALLYDNGVYNAAGLNPLPIKQSPQLLETLLAGVAKTNGNLNNLTMTTAVSTQTNFIQALNLSYMQVSTGAISHTEAVKRAVKSLSEQGIVSISYDKNGRITKHKLDVAVRRATLTGVNQTAAQAQLNQLDNMGWKEVETTAHLGARLSHQTWQGQIFSVNGSKHPNFYSSTGFGTGEGLCGWNCRHNFFPYLDGYSKPAYSKEELNNLENATVTYAGEKIPYYDATQIQRSLERKVRETKRTLVGLNTGVNSSKDNTLREILKKEFQGESVKLKANEKKLSSLQAQTSILRRRDREQVVGFNKTVSQRAVYNNKVATGQKTFKG